MYRKVRGYNYLRILLFIGKKRMFVELRKRLIKNSRLRTKCTGARLFKKIN